MSSFKHRPPKLKYRTDATTLDEIIKQVMEKADTNTKKLDYLNKTHDLIVSYYDKLTKDQYNNTKKNNSEIISLKTINKTDDKNNCENNTNINTNTNTNEDINDNNNNIVEPSNELKTLNLMSKNLRKKKKPIKKRILPTNNSESIFNFFKKDATYEEEENAGISNSNSISNIYSNLSKLEIQEKFLFIIDKKYACEKTRLNKSILCENCKIPKDLFSSEGSYICKQCGETEHIVMECENNENKEITFEKQKYPYKKINHLKEKLNQFQSKENADIPDSLYKNILNEIRKCRISNEDITPLVIRNILKKLRETTYYEHLQQIYHKIIGKPPTTLPRDTELLIINMFLATQESFQNHKGEKRSNFLNYAYVLNKLFKIIGLEEYSQYFYLLKSKNKLRDQDVIWEKICKDKGWKFYSSFDEFNF